MATCRLGTGLFLIAPKGGNLFAQTFGTGPITPGQGNGQGKFELFQGVLSPIGHGFCPMGWELCRMGHGS